jgi:hypothetical protein
MSRHARRLGLYLGVVFVLGAVAAASASAAPLEYRTCVKAAKSGKFYTGKYVDKTCTTPASEAQIKEGKLNKYESQAAAEEAPYTGKNKAATITAAGKTIVCKKGKSAGELTTERFATDTFTFEKCAIGKAACQSPGSSAGTIKSNLLHTGLVFLDEAETKVGVLVTSLGPILQIECGATTIQVNGHIIGSVTNTTKGMTETFAVSGGKQAARNFWVEEEGFGPFTLFTENEAEEEVEATLSLATEDGPKGVTAI